MEPDALVAELALKHAELVAPALFRSHPDLTSLVVVQTIAATTTRCGLTVEAVLDTNTYPTGVKVSAAEQKAIPLQKYAFHGEWNYIIHSGPIPKSVRNKTINLEPTK